MSDDDPEVYACTLAQAIATQLNAVRRRRRRSHKHESRRTWRTVRRAHER